MYISYLFINCSSKHIPLVNNKYWLLIIYNFLANCIFLQIVSNHSKKNHAIVTSKTLWLKGTCIKYNYGGKVTVVDWDVLNIVSKRFILLFNVLTMLLEFYGKGSTMNYILISLNLYHNKWFVNVCLVLFFNFLLKITVHF